MRAAHVVDQQQRVEADEQYGGQRIPAQEPRGAPHEPDDPERRGTRHGLQDPQSGRHSERRQWIGEQRENRPVDRLRTVRSRVAEHRVAHDRHRRVRVGIEPVVRAEPRVRDVGEDVLGEERRRQQKQHVEADDRADPDARRQVANARQHGDIEREREPQARVEERSRQRPVRAGQPREAKRPEQPARRAARGGEHDVRARRGRERRQRHVHGAQRRERGDPPHVWSPPHDANR